MIDLNRTKQFQQQRTGVNNYNNTGRDMRAGQMARPQQQSQSPLLDAYNSYQNGLDFSKMIGAKANDGMYQGVDLSSLQKMNAFKGMSDNDIAHAITGNNGAIDPKVLQQAVDNRMTMGNAMNGAQATVNNGANFLNNAANITNNAGTLASATNAGANAISSGTTIGVAADSALAGTTAAESAAAGASAAGTTGMAAALPWVGAGLGVYALGNWLDWW